MTGLVAALHHHVMSSLSRRHVLRTLSTASALPLLAQSRPALPVIGVQLYTVRDVLPQKPEETLKALDEIGFREAEVIRGNLDRIWPALQKTRLKPVSLHVDYALFAAEQKAQLSSAISDAKQKGFSHIVCPYVPPQERGGLEKMRQLAKRLNEAGQECHGQGLMLCYHNHAFEFEPMSGTTPMQVLLEETKPNLVGLELDMFWVSVAGHDPVALLKQQKGRVPLMHLKDKAKETPVQFNERVPKTAFREVGSGSLDVAAILKAAQQAGVKHYFVEQDQTPGDPVTSLRKSFEYLHGIRA